MITLLLFIGVVFNIFVLGRLETIANEIGRINEARLAAQEKQLQHRNQKNQQHNQHGHKQQQHRNPHGNPHKPQQQQHPVPMTI